jgi:predicted NAD/FAD-binding protein
MGDRRSIAVVGSGISGLSAAWLLSRRHAVSLFERDWRAGGHSNTVEVAGPSQPVAVDTGFIVYNTASYPNLVALFDHLKVPTAPTRMGFSVSIDEGQYEYSGNNLASLVGQPINVLRPGHWLMIADILRFFRNARDDLPHLESSSQTLGSYLSGNGYSEAFISRHILPMAAAIWSTPSSEILAFPAAAFVRFFDNHGLLRLSGRPQWRTVKGGSREYVRRMLDALTGMVALGTPVLSIRRTLRGVAVQTRAGTQWFDACVVATHADEAVALLADADGEERGLLGAFRYTKNQAVLHTDGRFMPKRRRLWSSWNYLGAAHETDTSMSVTYWMNALQPLQTTQDLFVTLNPRLPVRPDRKIATIAYRHPVFDRCAMAAQRELWALQGRRRTWFCGSYFGYGFHEDGLQSGLAVAEDVGGVRRPWTVDNESDRLTLTPRRRFDRAPVVEAAE